MLCLFLLWLLLRCSHVCEFVYSTGIAMGRGGGADMCPGFFLFMQSQNTVDQG